MIDATKYNTESSFIITDMVYPEYFTPAPTVADYDIGRITRYFVEKINTGEIFEINKNNFEEIGTVLYRKLSLVWYISGPSQDVKQGNVTIIRGTIPQNQDAIDQSKKSMSGIKSYLNNLSQFYK